MIDVGAQKPVQLGEENTMTLKRQVADELLPLCIGAFGGLLWWFLGLPDLVKLFMVLWCADIATGLLAGGKEGKLDSTISLYGVRRKAMMLLLVAVGAYAGQYTPGGPYPLADLIAGAFASTEIISIIENAGRVGLNVNFLLPYFRRLQPPDDKPPP